MSLPVTSMPPDDINRTIGQLCVGGDWACADGDLETLGHIAGRLATYADEPLHCKLVNLAELCRCDPTRAISTWMQLKEQIQSDRRTPQ